MGRVHGPVREGVSAHLRREPQAAACPTSVEQVATSRATRGCASDDHVTQKGANTGAAGGPSTDNDETSACRVLVVVTSTGSVV